MLLETFLQMKPEEKELMYTLCKRIAVEKDEIVFEELVRRLDELLEKTHDRLTPESRGKAS